MVSFSDSQYQDYVMRQNAKKSGGAVEREPYDGRESDIHDKILSWCAAQFPRVPVIHSRMDRASTIGVGVHDLTLFLPGGRVLCVEVKNKAGKLSPEQMGWGVLLSQVGHQMHVVRSYEEFLELVK